MFLKKTISSISFILVLLPIFGFSQYDNYNWILGASAGNNNNTLIKFNYNNITPDTFAIPKNQLFLLANSSISNDSGQLLFYTNGLEVYDSAFNLMSNGFGLSPSILGLYDSGIDAIILPKPSSNNLFYIFHETYDSLFFFQQIFDKQPFVLYQTTININLNGGLGSVIQKNEHIYQDTLIQGRLAACKHANGRDWWLISHKYYSNIYLKWLITPDTILGPYNQTIGSRIWIDGYGQACFNPQGTRFANYGADSLLDIMNFDRCTGLFSNCTTIHIPDSSSSGVGCAFSPNGRFVYTSNGFNLVQFDCDASNIALSGDTVAIWDGILLSGNPTYFGNLMLAIDNRIYINSDYTGALGVIENPDSIGLNCSVSQHSFSLPTICGFSLPKSPNYNLGRLQGSACDTLQWTSVADIEDNNKLLVYPNPASGTVTFDFVSGSNDKLDLKLFDNLGNEVKHTTVYASHRYLSLNISDLSEGVYFYKATSFNQKNFTGKVVVIK